MTKKHLSYEYLLCNFYEINSPFNKCIPTQISKKVQFVKVPLNCGLAVNTFFIALFFHFQLIVLYNVLFSLWYAEKRIFTKDFSFWSHRTIMLLSESICQPYTVGQAQFLNQKTKLGIFFRNFFLVKFVKEVLYVMTIFFLETKSIVGIMGGSTFHKKR